MQTISQALGFNWRILRYRSLQQLLKYCIYTTFNVVVFYNHHTNQQHY